MINITKINEVFIEIKTDKSIQKELSDYFSIFIDNWRYMREKSPRFYNWDGKIRLFNLKTKQIYYSLLKEVCEFAKDRDYKVKLSDKIKNDFGLNIKPDIIWQEYFNLLNKEMPFKLRDYQENTFIHVMRNKRCIIISPTSSGKTAMMYMICRYLLENGDVKKILIITPVTSLVEQMDGDFQEYGSPYRVHTIYGGREKTATNEIYVSTWQSIYEFNTDYFKEFDMVIQDEAHTGVNTNPKESKAIKGILEKCINAKYRVGMTGTLRMTKDKLLPVVGLLGETYKAIATKELMDRKEVSNIKINIIKLKYSDKECQDRRKYKDWHEEIIYLEEHFTRNMFIAKFIYNVAEKNTLVLFRHRKHGQNIHKELVKLTTTHDIEYIDGNTPVDDRESIRRQMERKNNVILVASYGTFAQGINIKNLHCIVFGSPMKSEIKVNQSLGRGLRLHAEKDKLILFDIADNFNIGAYKCYCMKHLLERLKIYNNEKFDYSEYEHKFK